MSAVHILVLLIGTAILDFTNASASVDVAWHHWKQLHAKQYVDSDEEGKRHDIWQQRVDEITKHNLRYDVGMETYKKGLNHLSDLSWDELKQMYLTSLDVDQAGVEGKHHKEMTGSVGASDLPESIDWRKKGYVTDVKNQGPCGSCWAFSTVGTLEGQLANKSKADAVSLSPQQLVDCAERARGCQGGWPVTALEYTQQNGVETLADYPYLAKNDNCTFNESEVEFKNEGGHLYVPQAGESKLQELVALWGPVSIAIDVTTDFFDYASGVFNTTQCQRKIVNHGVLAVGYGVDESGNDYWLVKNSWGTWWGEQGYIRMARNQHDMCNIATYPAVAII